MKPSNMAVMIALATLAGACEKNDVTILNDPDSKGTRWALEFDEKTKLKSEDAFKGALNSASSRWEVNLKIGNDPVRQFSSIPPHPKFKPSVTHFPREDGGAASLHVTQRVGLYSYDDYKRVLDQIENP